MAELGIQKDDAKDISNGINPLLKVKIANVAGYSKRKMDRANTIHLRGVCPKCGKFGMKYVKYMPTKSKSIKNKWYCKHCGTSATREELKYVKYV